MGLFARTVCRTHALLVFVAAAITCSATSVVAPRFDALVERAELIFTGEVIAQRSEWRRENGHKVIVTLVTFGVEQVHKGSAGRTVELRFLGGTVGDVSLDVAEIPRFKQGERAVLFVAGNGSAVSPVLGFYHGKFSLRRNAGGEEVFRYNGEALTGVDEVGQSGAKVNARGAAQPMSHEQFARTIREQLARTSKAP